MSAQSGIRRLLIPILLACAAPLAAAGDPQPIGPLEGTATAVLADPDDPQVLLVSTPADVLLRSTDAGSSFAPFGAGLPAGAPAAQLVLHPLDNDRVYALVDERIYESLDFGATWAPLSLMAAGELRRLAIHADGQLMLAIDANQLYRSATGGATWAPVGCPSAVYCGFELNDVAIAPSGPISPGFARVYLAHEGGVDVSDSGGVAWVAAAAPFGPSRAILIDPTNVGQIYVGGVAGSMSASSDGGGTLVPIETGFSSTTSRFLDFAPGSAQIILAGVDDGIWVTTDAGASWAPANAGFPTPVPSPSELDFDANGELLLAAAGSSFEGGLYRAPGIAMPWTKIAFPVVDVFDVAVAQPGGSRLVASADGVYVGAPGQVLEPSALYDAGSLPTNVLRIDPSDPDRWITGGQDAGTDLPVIRVATAQGSNVSIAYTGIDIGSEVTDLAIDPGDADRILAAIAPALSPEPGVIRSLDRGVSWQAAAGTDGLPVVSVAYDPHDGDHAIALLQDNRWAESTDGGASFVLQAEPWPAGGDGVLFAFDPFEPQRYYRADLGTGLQRSDDGGASWIPLGLTAHERSDIEFVPAAQDTFFYSDGSGQVHLSGDAGAGSIVVFDAPQGTNATGIDLALGDPALLIDDRALLVGTSGASACELPDASPFRPYGAGAAGTGGVVPRLYATSSPAPADSGPPETTLPQVGNSLFALRADRGVGASTVLLRLGLGATSVPLPGLLCGKLYVAEATLMLSLIHI